MNYSKQFFLRICFLTIFALTGVSAQWPVDPSVNVAVSTPAGIVSDYRIVTDGAGGSIVVWNDFRNGVDKNIYAQRISSTGSILWTANGVPVCTVAEDQGNVYAVSDGSGGAIIVWYDYRNASEYKIYAQRINASGVAQWTVNGVMICSEPGSQQMSGLSSDGSGGALIVWYEFRNGVNHDIYAQRINSSGSLVWDAAAVAVCTASGNQLNPNIVSDGASGGIVVWQDLRNFSYDLYAQRINASGAVQWTANGIVICDAASTQNEQSVIADGSGGAVVTWKDARITVSNTGIYSQKVNASGVVQWTANGVVVCNAAGLQSVPKLVSDGAGGAVIVWQDERNGNKDIYTQRLNGSGTEQWTSNGVVLCTIASDQRDPQIIMTSNGEIIIPWSDNRAGVFDIYAQRLSLTGGILWTANGEVVSSASNHQSTPQLVSDDAGGATIIWGDARNASLDIYAQGISVSSALPVELTSFTAAVVNSGIELRWNTATEVNNHGFEVERKNVSRFMSQVSGGNSSTLKHETSNSEWTRIAFVDGAGNSNSTHEYSYTDRSLSAGTYAFRLKQIDRDGKFTYSPEVEVTVASAPAKFELAQNYPNPFNPSTTIGFTLQVSGSTTLKIYDAIGREVATLVNENLEAGVYHQRMFDASNLASGIYFARLSSSGHSLVRKMQLMK
jgi:hypothetical protein